MQLCGHCLPSREQVAHRGHSAKNDIGWFKSGRSIPSRRDIFKAAIPVNKAVVRSDLVEVNVGQRGHFLGGYDIHYRHRHKAARQSAQPDIPREDLGIECIDRVDLESQVLHKDCAGIWSD
jgi:hypothetical protein